MTDQKNFPPVEEVLDAYQSLQEDYAVAMARIKELEAAHAETHAIELRAYEATVQNLEQRIRERQP